MKRGNKASDLYSTCCLRDGRAYNLFCEKNPHIQISQKEYDTLLIKFQHVLINEVLSNPDGVEIPNGLGDLKIMGVVPRIPPKDFKNTKLYGKPIFLTNAHTFGIKYRMLWIYKYTNHKLRKLARFKNMELYIFKTSKFLKRKMYEKILDDAKNKSLKFYIAETTKGYNT